MNVAGTSMRTIWPEPDGSVSVIDQTRLPHAVEISNLRTAEDAARAIETMVVRGAPLIGATAAYGLRLALAADPTDAGLAAARDRLVATRPTAIDLRWALERVTAAVGPLPAADRGAAAASEAARICEDSVAVCSAIGDHGLPLIEAVWTAQNRPVNVLTHCNAGWLATVDWGTATAPIYKAHEAGIPVHVWVDETRPRNQGALTAWELGAAGVPHTVIVDNSGGHLMQRGMVDLCIVGTDRTIRTGDVVNKIGTYLKALAAADNDVPFYVALPSSTIDWHTDIADIPIEERSPDEVTTVTGVDEDGIERTVRIVPEGVAAANYAFDVTPAHLVTGLITERGISPPDELASLFPDRH